MSILRDYLEKCHQSLLNEFNRAAVASTHSGDLGENREHIIVDFINNNQPRRLSAYRGGQVIGVNGDESRQIDILVTHDSTIEFRDHGKSFRIAEAILAGIAVKSDLTRERLIDDFKTLASIPAPSHDVLKLSHAQHDGLFHAYACSFPSRMIIGWRGATSETLLAALSETVSKPPYVPVNHLPDVVTVLERGYSLQLTGKKEFLKGRISRENVGWGLVPESAGVAWPLVWLLNQLSAASGWSAMFTVDLQPYWSAT